MSVPIVATSALSKTFWTSSGWLAERQPSVALDNISFTLSEGETLAVVGETGSGKSTLARLVAGAEQPDRGFILLEGRELRHYPKNSRLSKIRYIAQNPALTFSPAHTVGEQLAWPLRNLLGCSPTAVQTRLDGMLAKVGIEPDQKHLYPGMFSGGQLQRLALARALLTNPRLLVADEPLSALDVSIQAQMLNLLLELQRDTGVALLLVSHNLTTVHRIAHQMLVLYGGRTMERGPVDDVLRHPVHPYTRSLIAATPGLATRNLMDWKPKGMVQTLRHDRSQGCPYVHRCPLAKGRCHQEMPQERNVRNQLVACHYADETP
jgi:dipeptide transport system ATP-binding protein